MTSRFCALAATLLLAACSSTPPAVTPDAAPPTPPLTTTPAPPAATAPAAAAPPATTPAPPATTAPAASPPPATTPIEGATFEAALTAAHLTTVQLKLVERTRAQDMSAPPAKSGDRQVTLTLKQGFNADPVDFAQDAAGRVVRLVRRPDMKEKDIVVKGCQESAFAGGRAWMDRVVFELPPGTTWGGEQIVKYSVVKEVVRYTGKKPNGQECPPPAMMHD